MDIISQYNFYIFLNERFKRARRKINKIYVIEN